MIARFGCLAFLAGGFMLGQTLAAHWEWKAGDGVPLERAALGFVLRGDRSCFHSGAGGMVIETSSLESAWLEWPLLLRQPGALLDLEITVAADAEPGAAAIHLACEGKGVFVWLWEKSYLRVSTDGKNNHQYFPAPVGRPQTYRFVVEGTQVRLFAEGLLIYAGALEEPMETVVLSVGDLTHGGGKMTVSGLKIAGDLREPDSAWLSWQERPEVLERPIYLWPTRANALLLTADYHATAPRAGMTYFVCRGSYGRRVVAAALAHHGVASGENCSERILVAIPPETETVQMAADFQSPAFVLQRLTLMPVRVLVANQDFQRAAGLSVVPVGQSFEMPSDPLWAGVAASMTRSFAAEEGDRLRFTAQQGGGGQEISAREIPREFEGFAVCLFDRPRVTSGSNRFTFSISQTEDRFFGWYEYEYSLINPFAGGQMQTGERTEEELDLVFSAFAGFPSFYPVWPAALRAVGGDGEVALSWGEIPGASGYTLKVRGPGTDSFVTLLANTLEASYLHQGLQNGERYFYRIAASNAAGEGPDSETVEAVPQSGPLHLLSSVTRKRHGESGVFTVDVSSGAAPTSSVVPVDPRSGDGLEIVASFNKPLSEGRAVAISGQAEFDGEPICRGRELVIRLRTAENAQTLQFDLRGTQAEDGTVLASGTLTFRMLRGDVDGNGVVDQRDFDHARSKVGRDVDTATFRSDWDASGTITAADIVNIRHAQGNSAP